MDGYWMNSNTVSTKMHPLRIILTPSIPSWLCLLSFFFFFFGAGVVSVSGKCLEDQKSFLVTIKQNLVSTKVKAWNESLDCCSWSGVGCDEQGRVIDLDLSFEWIEPLVINDSSPLFDLKYLQRLNLAGNYLQFNEPPTRFNEIGNLTYLNLSSFGFSGQIPIGISSLTKLVTLDISSDWFSPECSNMEALVQNLTSLEELRLDGVRISSSSSGGDEWCRAIASSTPRLRALSLSNCNLTGSICEALQNLNHLSELNLANRYETRLTFKNQLTGPIPSLSRLKSLKHLDLSSNLLAGPIPSLSALRSLEHLDLSSNLLAGPIPSLSALRSLEHLDLSSNLLAGAIQSTHWQGLSQLEYLGLRGNMLQGSIPVSIFSLPSLTYLDLSYNQFTAITTNEQHLNMSSSLPSIDLAYNRINGPIPAFLFKLQNLASLDLSSNNFSRFDINMMRQSQSLVDLNLSNNSISIDSNGTDVAPSSFPQLIYFKMASCKLTTFPDFLRTQHSLFNLDLSDNLLSGKIPYWIWKSVYGSLNLSYNHLEDMGRPTNIPSIMYLDLRSNRFQGDLSFLPNNAEYLEYSENNFSSIIPRYYNSTQLQFLSFSNNKFHGIIPESLCNNTSLLLIDLSGNLLTGPIPQCLIELGKTIQVMKLGKNNLNGTLSDIFPENCTLETLDLNGNLLNGHVPKSLGNCAKLQVLNLGNNEIIDTFPCWLKTLPVLHVLVLRSNKFYGDLACKQTNQTWAMLQIVDLASNNFEGRVDSGLFLSHGMMIREGSITSLGRRITGSYYQDTITLSYKNNEVEFVKILSIFVSVDLSNNKLEGEIPDDLGDFKALFVLNMSYNSFTGQIPSSLGKLKQLESLDLSNNELSGTIPQELADLNFLSVLNLSFNRLEGMIPQGTQFDTFSDDSFLGNAGLCGAHVAQKCSHPPTFSDNKDMVLDTSDTNWGIIGALIGFALGLAIVIWPLVFCRRLRIWYFSRVDRVLLKILKVE